MPAVATRSPQRKLQTVEHFWTRPFHQRCPFPKRCHIVGSRPDSASGLAAAGLKRSLSVPNHDHVIAEVAQPKIHGPLKAIAIGNQEDERRNPPHDAQDGHERPLPVGDEITRCLAQDLPDHHSYLNASMGSVSEAMKAG